MNSCTNFTTDLVGTKGGSCSDGYELTTVQAAEILNVSRPYLIKLLDEGALSHRKVGKHHRIRMEDVMAYKSRIDQDREAVLDELVADAQQNDMGYSRA